MLKKVKNLLKEPLIHFLILGAVLFCVNNYVQQQTDKQSREIIVDNERIGLMLTNYKTQTGVLPNKQQLDAIIENYIKDEVSYREATKMGLERDDEIIRRRLVQKFDFLQTDLAVIAPATEEELRQFYNNNPALFRKDATVSFSHIFFSTDNSTDSIAKQRAFNVLQQLKSAGVQRAPERGDRFPLQYDYTDQAVLDIQQNFGDKPMARELFQTPVNTWAGPVQSGYGWHLVYIIKRDSANLIPYASVQEEVRTQYMEAEKTKQNKKLFEQLSEKYVINRSYLETK